MGQLREFGGRTGSSPLRAHEQIVEDGLIQRARQHPEPLMAIQPITLEGIFNLIVPNSNIRDRVSAADSIGDPEVPGQRCTDVLAQLTTSTIVQPIARVIYLLVVPFNQARLARCLAFIITVKVSRTSATNSIAMDKPLY